MFHGSNAMANIGKERNISWIAGGAVAGNWQQVPWGEISPDSFQWTSHNLCATYPNHSQSQVPPITIAASWFTVEYLLTLHLFKLSACRNKTPGTFGYAELWENEGEQSLLDRPDPASCSLPLHNVPGWMHWACNTEETRVQQLV